MLSHTSECHKEQRVRGAKGQKKSQRMKICINLMRFQEASGIFINSLRQKTHKTKISSFLSIFAFLFHLLFGCSGEAKKANTTRFDGIKECWKKNENFIKEQESRPMMMREWSQKGDLLIAIYSLRWLLRETRNNFSIVVLEEMAINLTVRL